MLSRSGSCATPEHFCFCLISDEQNDWKIRKQWQSQTFLSACFLSKWIWTIRTCSESLTSAGGSMAFNNKWRTEACPQRDLIAARIFFLFRSFAYRTYNDFLPRHCQWHLRNGDIYLFIVIVSIGIQRGNKDQHFSLVPPIHIPNTDD